ncbi:MAG: hypothetical protein NVS1B14_05910 [Vulcanimicrobiaceae bacterium]
MNDAKAQEEQQGDNGGEQQGACAAHAIAKEDKHDYLPFFGTLAPERRASESPIAIACFRLVTFLPERPDSSLPRFISCMVFLTFRWEAAPNFRLDFLRVVDFLRVLRTVALRVADFLRAVELVAISDGPPQRQANYAHPTQLGAH